MLLTSKERPQADETAARVQGAFHRQGWHVETACIDTLALDAGTTRVDTPRGRVRLADVDLLWVLGFGRAATFLDKMQLLAALPARVPFVNAVSALLTLHAKYPIADAGDAFPQPETHAAHDADALAAVARRAGGRWVLKPPAGSFGRGVTVAEAGSDRLLEAARALTEGGRYALLQRWCPEVLQEETRVLIAGGSVVGCYARERAAGADAANLSAGGRPVPAKEDPARDALASRAAALLAERGVQFAGLDVAGPWILEANVINPGGVATLEALGDVGVADRIVERLLTACTGTR
ncbi:MAG: hypothetical protein V2J24_13900 [Pseudomonadales bacterium]|nr:hypothetical protein [Pseudomonadales bacterium]